MVGNCGGVSTEFSCEMPKVRRWPLSRARRFLATKSVSSLKNPPHPRNQRAADLEHVSVLNVSRRFSTHLHMCCTRRAYPGFSSHARTSSFAQPAYVKPSYRLP